MDSTSLSIDDAGQAILDSPVYFGNSGNLYSYEQMIYIFKHGFDLAVKTLSSQEKETVKPYSIMKNMQVGQSVEFSQDKANAARSAASLLKKQFGYIFMVRKITAEKNGVLIHVRRNC